MTNHTTETEASAHEGRRDAQHASPTKKRIDRVYLVPYPNVVFLYPTLIVSLISAIGMTVLGDSAVADGSRVPHALSTLFLGIMAINLIVLTVDFPRATALTLFFVGCTAVLGVVLSGTFFPDMIPWIKEHFVGLHPLANASFFWIITILLLVMLLTVKIAVQFDYWEVRQNELLHHHGMLSDLRRYPTSGLQVEKEITDVFEYMLLRSGRLILRPPGTSRDLVLENIAFIDTKEKQLTQLLSAKRVEISTDEG
ncbi:MAG: hypothetical protein KDB22_12560 [Planctomycetales bacterium]|nr:hypothetical protein [Planctomycetales bacterium]